MHPGWMCEQAGGAILHNGIVFPRIPMAMHGFRELIGLIIVQIMIGARS